jgi:hypothetical protein
MTEVRQLGEDAGGSWVSETHFLALGNQVNSMVSWLAYMKRGEPRERLLGIRLPPPNLQPDFEAQANAFVDGLADGVLKQPLRAGAGQQEQSITTKGSE